MIRKLFKLAGLAALLASACAPLSLKAMEEKTSKTMTLDEFKEAIKGESPLKIDYMYQNKLNKDSQNNANFKTAALDELIDWIQWAAIQKKFGSTDIKKLTVSLQKYITKKKKDRNKAVKKILLVRTLFYPTDTEKEAIKNNTKGIKNKLLKKLEEWKRWHKTITINNKNYTYNSSDFNKDDIEKTLKDIAPTATLGNLTFTKDIPEKIELVESNVPSDERALTTTQKTQENPEQKIEIPNSNSTEDPEIQQILTKRKKHPITWPEVVSKIVVFCAGAAYPLWRVTHDSTPTLGQYSKIALIRGLCSYGLMSSVHGLKTWRKGFSSPGREVFEIFKNPYFHCQVFTYAACRGTLVHGDRFFRGDSFIGDSLIAQSIIFNITEKLGQKLNLYPRSEAFCAGSFMGSLLGIILNYRKEFTGDFRQAPQIAKQIPQLVKTLGRYIPEMLRKKQPQFA
ncbi:MAG: hypothetical protein UV38_C0003G0256 [candidate division TM6 bacterium GW2011_GWE2_42_60]|nr:MAG: hypothetical protein UV38_C0003G0256 [candidate division TM6 bacterium GW2011_GWE2_42_60]HBY05875.1 hypothetical protein [Candidatus Dependentiae bacterium]